VKRNAFILGKVPDHLLKTRKTDAYRWNGIHQRLSHLKQAIAVPNRGGKDKQAYVVVRFGLYDMSCMLSQVVLASLLQNTRESAIVKPSSRLFIIVYNPAGKVVGPGTSVLLEIGNIWKEDCSRISPYWLRSPVL